MPGQVNLETKEHQKSEIKKAIVMKNDKLGYGSMNSLPGGLGGRHLDQGRLPSSEEQLLPEN